MKISSTQIHGMMWFYGTNEFAHVFITEQSPVGIVGDWTCCNTPPAQPMKKCGFMARFVFPTPIARGTNISKVTLSGVGGLELGIPSQRVKCTVRAELNNVADFITDDEEYKKIRGLCGFTGNVSAPVAFDNQIMIEGNPWETTNLKNIVNSVLSLGDITSMVFFIDDHDGLSLENNVYSIAPSIDLNIETVVATKESIFSKIINMIKLFFKNLFGKR